ncbi:MAG TPA: hypothetical protein VFV27_11705 [Nevskiaceae bacterium]|nr:hypothetical protein [Nevskiaceae bacterium]
MRRVGAGCLLLLALAGCSRSLGTPDLGALYTRAAQADDRQRNPIIVIPGILGSRLREGPDGRVVWGAFESGAADVREPEGLRALALPIEAGQPLAALRDELIADRVLDRIRVQLFRLPLESRAYFRLLAALGAGGYRDQDLAGEVDYGGRHFTCFQFPYDWRRDIGENAAALADFIAAKRHYVEGEMRRRYGEVHPVRFDLVAHSMGGLVARHYLYYGREAPPAEGVPWRGAAGIERVVLIAPPNAGSLDALNRLVEGADYSWLLPHFEAGLLGTFPAIYQLLPRARHGALLENGQAADPLDPALWRRQRWGLLDPAQAPVLAALLPQHPDPAQHFALADEHLVKSLARAAAVQEALDRPAEPPPGLSLHLLVGDAVPTLARYRIGPAGALEAQHWSAGDGLVTRASALLDERADGHWRPRLRTPLPWDSVMFFQGEHLALMESPAFIDNLLYLLLEQPTP